jgi:hypothetical protein
LEKTQKFIFGYLQCSLLGDISNCIIQPSRRRFRMTWGGEEREVVEEFHQLVSSGVN